MTESEAAELAREVVRELFTNGAGEKAQRLILEPPNLRPDLGGWSEEGAMKRVTAILLKHSKKMGMGKRR